MSKKNKIYGELKAWLHITLGCFIVAMGFVLFISPYKMVPGGMYGCSIVLHQLWPDLQVGTYSYMLQIPLMLLVTVLIGRKLGVRTLFTVLITPFIMNMATYIAYPDADALRTLDPKSLFGGVMDLTDHLIVASAFGGLMVGVGSGLIIRNQSGTGGTDLVGMLMNKFLGIRFTKAILIVDSSIILLGLAVTGSPLLAFYSLIAVVGLNKGLGFVLNGSRDAKIIYIICDRNTEEIKHHITDTLDLTATCLPCHGLYSGAEKEMLMMVVHEKSVPHVTKSITDFVPEAFVIVADAFETYGTRWRDFPEKDELML